MYSYIIGNIKEINTNSIVIDNNGIGYFVYTPNPYSLKLGEEIKVYIYQHIKEDENTLFGFKTIEEKDVFLKLIEVKGLGPKMVLSMLAVGSVSGIIDAIERENILYLKKFPRIGDKVARQIIFDLKGKLVKNDKEVERDTLDDLAEALKGLGYKMSDIRRVLPKINNKLDLENQLKEALKLLLR